MEIKLTEMACFAWAVVFALYLLAITLRKVPERYPLVTLDFLRKTTKEQIIENNQEIHEINKKLDELLEGKLD